MAAGKNDVDPDQTKDVQNILVLSEERYQEQDHHEADIPYLLFFIPSSYSRPSIPGASQSGS